VTDHAHRIEPVAVAERVDRYVDRALRDAAKFDNSAPLDVDGVWDLHRLAAEIYAIGHEDGERVADARHRAKEVRDKMKGKTE
jgi:hypothetical protein